MSWLENYSKRFLFIYKSNGKSVQKLLINISLTQYVIFLNNSSVILPIVIWFQKNEKITLIFIKFTLDTDEDINLNYPKFYPEIFLSDVYPTLLFSENICCDYSL